MLEDLRFCLFVLIKHGVTGILRDPVVLFDLLDSVLVAAGLDAIVSSLEGLPDANMFLLLRMNIFLQSMNKAG